MAEYVEKNFTKDHLSLESDCGYVNTLADVFKIIDALPAADVVPKGAYDQVAWERDVAIEQLREDYGVGLGEKKRADVVEVKRGRWIRDEDEYCYWYVCSECGYDTLNAGHSHDWDWRSNFCPHCGKYMREVAE